MGILNALVREKDKKGIFTSTQTQPMYSTGLFPLDFANGYVLEVSDPETKKIIKRQRMTGIVAGSIITIYGLSGTSKSALAVRIASAIIEPFSKGEVYHGDAEQALNYQRIISLSGLPIERIENDYELNQTATSIEDFKLRVSMIADAKRDNKKEFMYDTGLLDEFGQPIHAYEPTVIIADSIPSMHTKEATESEELTGQTYDMRRARALSTFTSTIMNDIKETNIIFIFINHVKDKPESFSKTQAQTMFLGNGQVLPGGTAPIYYANNIFGIITRGKDTRYSIANGDDFNGFDVEQIMVKSRTAPAGGITHLVYDQDHGYSNIRSCYKYAENNGLIGGRNPKRYFIDVPDIKFDSRTLSQYIPDKEWTRSLYTSVLKHMDSKLVITDNIDKFSVSQEEVYRNVISSMEMFNKEDVV